MWQNETSSQEPKDKTSNISKFSNPKTYFRNLCSWVDEWFGWFWLICFILYFQSLNRASFCGALLLYLYKRDFLIHFPSHRIQTGDLPVTGLPLWPPGYTALLANGAVRNKNTTVAFKKTFPYSSKMLRRTSSQHFPPLDPADGPRGHPVWLNAVCGWEREEGWNRERERESCPWYWYESTARGLVCYYGYSCLSP